MIAGGSGGSRVSLLTVARNPDIATGLAMDSRSSSRPGAVDGRLTAVLEPPWGDREWIERGEQRDAPGESLFKSWPLLVPQLAGFGQQIP